MKPSSLTRLAAAAVACVALGGAALAGEKKPQYGGTLDVTTEYGTLSVLSWDPYDWNWKLNQDLFYAEQLMAGDLSKSKARGGPFPFTADAWLPAKSIRGELAESWEFVQNPLAVVFHLRKGIMWPAKPGVMEAREFVADDVVFSFNRLNSSPKKIGTYFDYVDRVEAKDKHTVVFHFKEYNAEWDYRFGWGYYSVILPKELADAGAANWKNATGTGPFQLVDFTPGNSQSYKKNPDYWDKTVIDGAEYKLPFVDQLNIRTIKDEATQHTALRTAKIDMLRAIRWQAVENLKKTAPQLQWRRDLSVLGQYLAMRVDSKPFDDIRVRRALNMAVNKEEIVKEYYAGNAELLAYPMSPDWEGYYQKLAEMPESVRELFVYDPKKAKKLLAEAGHPNGFSFKVQVCACAPDHMDLLPLVAGYLEQIGVKAEIEPMEYGAFLSAMTTKKNTPGYMMNNGFTNPTTAIRKNFVTGQTWNAAQYGDPKYDERVAEMYRTPDEQQRIKMLRELTVEILDKAPYIWLPTPYVYSAWWPWVKNYGAETAVGAVRTGPIFANLWIDQELKKQMGY